MCPDVANKANPGMESSLTGRAHASWDGLLDDYSSSLASFTFSTAATLLFSAVSAPVWLRRQLCFPRNKFQWRNRKEKSLGCP